MMGLVQKVVWDDMWGSPKMGPCNTDFNELGLILGSPILGNYHVDLASQ